MIKVLVVEDQKIVRECLRDTINKDSDLKVIGCSENGKEALKVCEREIPDVVLMDIGMPVCNGIECTKLLKAKYGNIKIIILTIFEDDLNVLNALNNGADSYVLKDISPEELILTIKSVVAGLSIMNKSAFDSVLNQANLKTPSPLLSNNLTGVNLTERELTAIRLIVNGKDYKEIASILHLSEGSVRNLISDILQKLDLKDRVQLAVYAVKNDLC
jgi:DNA-binding NarL/FixJ family response regulator